jgi:hypothetical protein
MLKHVESLKPIPSFPFEPSSSSKSSNGLVLILFVSPPKLLHKEINLLV